MITSQSVLAELMSLDYDARIDRVKASINKARGRLSRKKGWPILREDATEISEAFMYEPLLAAVNDVRAGKFDSLMDAYEAREKFSPELHLLSVSCLFEFAEELLSSKNPEGHDDCALTQFGAGVWRLGMSCGASEAGASHVKTARWDPATPVQKEALLYFTAMNALLGESEAVMAWLNFWGHLVVFEEGDE